MAHLKSVDPVSDEDVNALPVKEIGPAVSFYEKLLGFVVVTQDASTAVVRRDDVEVGLVCQPDHDPGKAGSLAFEVDDLDALHRELSAAGGSPGEFDEQEWDDIPYRTFFVREAENGYCFCFYHPAPTGP